MSYVSIPNFTKIGENLPKVAPFQKVLPAIVRPISEPSPGAVFTGSIRLKKSLSWENDCLVKSKMVNCASCHIDRSRSM